MDFERRLFTRYAGPSDFYDVKMRCPYSLKCIKSDRCPLGYTREFADMLKETGLRTLTVFENLIKCLEEEGSDLTDLSRPFISNVIVWYLKRYARIVNDKNIDRMVNEFRLTTREVEYIKYRILNNYYK